MKKSSLLLIISLTTILSHSATFSTVPMQGLVAYYRFAGNAADSSGNGFNGTVAGAVLAADRFGNASEAYSFNGYSSTIRCGDILDNVFSAPIAKFSVSGWANTRTYGGFESGGGFLVGKNAGGNYGPYQWGVSHVGGLIIASVFSDTAQANYVELGCPMGLNQWFHFVLTFDGSQPVGQRIQLHVNGQTSGVYVYQQMGTLGTTTTNSLQQLTIGASHNANAPLTPNNFYDGRIDEISIYDRVLTESEIQSMYHDGGWPVSLEPGLVAYYPFSGNANDMSGNGFNGTVIGATPVPDRFGNLNSAYSFNGTTNYIRLGDILDSVFCKPVAQFSVSGWAKTNVPGTTYVGGGFIIGKECGGALSGGHQWNVAHLDTRLFCWVNSDSAALNSIDMTNPAPVNQWYHFVFIFDGSLEQNARIKIYVNGSSNMGIYGQAGSLGTSTQNTSQELTIGAGHVKYNPSIPNNAYNGLIDDIRIYNRVIPLSKIDSLYHEGGWEGTSGQGLVAYYPLDGNANDLSGSGFNATVAGAALTSDRFGVANRAYSFNGINSMIRCGDILDSVFASEVAKFTVTGWSKTRTYGTMSGGGGFIVGKNGGGGAHAPAQWNVTNTDIGLYGAVFSDTVANNYIALMAPPIPKNQWFHFALVFDGSQPELQRVKLYVNAVSTNSSIYQHAGTLGIRTTASQQNVTMGASHPGGHPTIPENAYDGAIDDIRIYNRVLSDAEIQAMYHEGGWPTSTDTTLHAARLESVYIPNAGNVPLTSLSFSSNGSYDSGGVIDSVCWFVNGNLVGRNSDLTYQFTQGTNLVKLVVQDNLGIRDSSIAKATISDFKVFLNGPILAGPSLLGRGVLYVIGTGDAVYRLDSAGNILYSLQVNGSIKSSSTIAFDTTVYIGSSDKNLYAFSKFGNEVWTPLAMGGALNSTPAADSITNRLYVGVSNKNFVAVDRSTGTVSWNYFADAPIASSAAITPDRKLVFASVIGTVYGFDLTNLTSPPLPTWQIPLSDSIYSSPAVDDEGYSYYCTTGGKIFKIAMFQGEPASIVWQMQTGGAITGSPVIDGNGVLYVGCGDSKLYSVNITNGSINWTYQSGSSILSTPAISNIGMIYFGNHGGKVIALDSNCSVHWCYQDSASVDAPLLYENGTLYVGTTSGRFLAFYDDADSIPNAVSSSYGVSGKPEVAIQPPLWGTFHGDNQRTGVATHLRVTKVDDKTNMLPGEYGLSQNYPNPFNPSTTIRFAVPVRSHVKIEVFNVLGQRIVELVNGDVGAGYYEKEWQAAVSSGLYLYRIEAVSLTDPGKHFVAARKMLLLK